MMKKFTFFTLFLMIVAVAVIGGSPYYTLYQLKNAYESQNIDSINQQIDFPKLQQDLKSQLTPALNKKAEKITNLPLLKAFDINIQPQTMIEKLVNQGVDNAVTPNGFKQLFTNITKVDKNSQLLGGLMAVALDKIDIQALITARNQAELQRMVIKQLNAPNPNPSNQQTSAVYCGFHCFKVDTQVHGYPITVHMQRQGLIDWKIVGIKLPI